AVAPRPRGQARGALEGRRPARLRTRRGRDRGAGDARHPLHRGARDHRGARRGRRRGAAAHPSRAGEQCHAHRRALERRRPARLALSREPAAHRGRLHGCGSATGHRGETRGRRSRRGASGSHHRAGDAARAADPARHALEHRRARAGAPDRAALDSDTRRRGGLRRHRGGSGAAPPGERTRSPGVSAQRAPAGGAASGFVGAVGNTPLIPLKRVSEETGCRILGKAEFMNPGGSLPNAIWSNQFANTANRDAHARTTGPEIWEQTNGRIDAFVAASGTGGTFAGVAEYLKSRRRAVRCVLADPPGSSLYEYVRSGTLRAAGSASITEGIGIGRVTRNLEGAPIDEAVHIEDGETVRHVYRLLHEEGLLLGSTSGINVAAAVRVARSLGPGHIIVTVLCDGGAKYQSRLF